MPDFQRRTDIMAFHIDKTRIDLFPDAPSRPAIAGAWIAVACAAHVARGRRDGFMQVCHGKCGPLARIAPGDRVAYYSPSRERGDGKPYRMFTAIGTVRPGEPYPFDQGGGFMPYRRDVDWDEGEPAEILPLLGELDLTRGQRNWGSKFRFGLVRATPEDLMRIAAAMRVRLPG